MRSEQEEQGQRKVGADSWLLGSRCDRVVTCASEVAKEGTVKDGNGYSGGCFGYWESSRARRGTGVGEEDGL